MANNVKPVPNGFHTITPYLTVPAVGKLIDFLKQAFDATEIERMQRPDGSVGHAEVKIGDSVVMLGEPPDPSKAKPAALYLYVDDVDATYRRAVEAGAASLSEPANMFSMETAGPGSRTRRATPGGLPRTLKMWLRKRSHGARPR